MKAYFLFLTALICLSCNNAKKLTSEEQLLLLNGQWELNYISGPKITFEGLYPAAKPFIIFDVANSKVTGKTGCNNFNGPFSVKDKVLRFPGPLAMTKMYCPGSGEQVFVDALKQVTSYYITDDTLHMLADENLNMRFIKRVKQ